MSAFSSLPLFPPEVLARKHAILSTIGFLILLPLGIVLARYARTFTNRWFFGHAIIQLLLSGPIIFAGWYYGWKAADTLGNGHYYDPHTKMGLALLILYVIQLAWGLFIHAVKTPSPFGPATRPPQNYFHVFLGLVIMICAAWQVHYGMWIEWPNTTGDIHDVPQSAKHAWIALVVIFWVLYIAGLALVPKQFSQEKRAREKA